MGPSTFRNIAAALSLGLGMLPTSLLAQARVTYTVQSGDLYRIEVSAGATPENLSLALDSLSPGAGDEWVNTSPDGNWLLVSSERFHSSCVGWACLAVVQGDLATGAAVEIGGEVVHGDFGAIASNGRRIVWSANGGNHAIDLWTSHHDGAGWGAAQLLTAASSYAFNAQPALSEDGKRVVFDCGDAPYAAAGTAICEVGVDATGFRVVLTPLQGGGTASNALHHADYAPGGGIVFEGQWDGEQIWRLAPGSTTPTKVTAAFNNDNSPCVLADGRIVSLWLDRAGGQGYHELKVMAADGSGYQMILLGVDILDGGLGCSNLIADRIFADGFE